VKTVIGIGIVGTVDTRLSKSESVYTYLCSLNKAITIKDLCKHNPDWSSWNSTLVLIRHLERMGLVKVEDAYIGDIKVEVVRERAIVTTKPSLLTKINTFFSKLLKLKG
jgi:hypothetical protein